MNINLKRFIGDSVKLTALEMTMGLSKFRPGEFVKYTNEMPGDKPAKYRVLGATLSEDTAGLLGFFYSIQHPTLRNVFHDVAEYELEFADEQRNTHGGSVPSHEGVLGIPNGSGAD